MKPTLITCFKNETTLVQACHLINSLKQESPHREIHLATFRDLEPTAKVVCHQAKLHFVDRYKIEHLKSGALYSDAFAVNSLIEDINFALETEWDKAINLSNDDISSYLLPLINAETMVGSYVSSNGSAATSDKWASYRNFYISQSPLAPIEALSTVHHSSGTVYRREGSKVAMKEDFTMVANQNFARIRASKGENCHVIGINLAPGHDGSTFDFDFLSNVVETLEYSENFKPVLLIGGKDQEKAVCDELNAQFGNRLISINMDVSAAPSVMGNIDFLISRPSTMSAIADALDTRVLEVSNDKSKCLAFNEGCFHIIESEGPASEDVLFVIGQEFDEILPMAVKNSQNKVYARVKDDMGLLNTLIRGEIDLQAELSYHVSRCYHYALLGYPIDHKILQNLKDNAPLEALEKFCSKEKEELVCAVKALLNTIRSLQAFKQSEKNAPKFVQYLDQLMDFSKMPNVAQAPVCLFEAAIENINSTDPKVSLSIMEENLYKLKSDLQTLAKIFEGLLAENEAREFFEKGL